MMELFKKDEENKLSILLGDEKRTALAAAAKAAVVLDQATRDAAAAQEQVVQSAEGSAVKGNPAGKFGGKRKRAAGA